MAIAASRCWAKLSVQSRRQGCVYRSCSLCLHSFKYHAVIVQTQPNRLLTDSAAMKLHRGRKTKPVALMELLTQCRKLYKSRVKAAGFPLYCCFWLRFIHSFLLLYLLLTKGHNLESAEEKIASLGAKLSARWNLKDQECVI